MAITRIMGSDPDVWGSHFMQITHVANTNATGWFRDTEKKIIGFASAAYDKNMVSIFCWHVQDPYEQKSFNVSGLKKETVEKSFRSLLPGGEKHDWYKGKLRKVAEVVNSIKGKDGTLSPVIFRPFHEFDGSWFWWGKKYCTPQEYQTLWKFKVTYLRDELKVHNRVCAFSPGCKYKTELGYHERYPGDEYVALVGFDTCWVTCVTASPSPFTCSDGIILAAFAGFSPNSGTLMIMWKLSLKLVKATGQNIQYPTRNQLTPLFRKKRS